MSNCRANVAAEGKWAYWSKASDHDCLKMTLEKVLT